MHKKIGFLIKVVLTALSFLCLSFLIAAALYRTDIGRSVFFNLPDQFWNEIYSYFVVTNAEQRADVEFLVALTFGIVCSMFLVAILIFVYMLSQKSSKPTD